MLLLGLALWGVQFSYDWDLSRCRVLPDHYITELFWGLVIGPIGLGALLFSAVVVLFGLWGQHRQKHLPWIVFGIGTVIILGGFALAVAALFGPCPPAS